MIRPGAATVCTVAALAVLAGCSAEPASTDESGDPTKLGLSGPWAQEFADAIASSESDSERAILADGIVTPQELEQAHAGVGRCLADSNLEINYFKEGGFELGKIGGGSSGMPFEKSDAILRACEKQFDDSVTYLFEQTRRNPERLDEVTIEIACFKGAGLVPKSYSRADRAADYDAGTGPYDDVSEPARKCLGDPLGLWWDAK